MKAAFEKKSEEIESLHLKVQESWSRIAPFWPLKNLVAVNPLHGFEDLPFEEALQQAQNYFQQRDLPEPMQAVNRETIKWLQAFFDEGQATIKMPLRHGGLLKAIHHLLPFDKNICSSEKNITWLKNLSHSPEDIIAECLSYLHIPTEMHTQYLTLMLTTLPGWASYIQYYVAWADSTNQSQPYPLTRQDYTAFRLLLTCLLWPEGKRLLDWHNNASQNTTPLPLESLQQSESAYRISLLKKLSKQRVVAETSTNAQLVFCIDVRSESFRRALEVQGRYETLGFAGFFGVPVSINNDITGERYASCPVLLKPEYHVKENPACLSDDCQKGYNQIQIFRKLYQSLKYTFTTPFALVETLGIVSGFWMGIRTFLPHSACTLRNKVSQKFSQNLPVIPNIESIPFEAQCQYAESALKMMGLTMDFAQLVVFCGHGSTTQNNAYATALDCGACGGHQGAPNARILASILNDKGIRDFLKDKNIVIPETTHFLGAKHDTTTDIVEIYHYEAPEKILKDVALLTSDLEKAREMNSQWRAQEMGLRYQPGAAAQKTSLRAHDWAQVRPEWGLARNAAFIVGPRSQTQNIHLEGRTFLHSYDWKQDEDGTSLTTILTAPMIVAQWINTQYLFSTLDNVAFGGGSKITKNITGKIGIMQGNASDLMHGLPLQSVFKTDHEPYHEPLRLMTIVYAPPLFIDRIISQQEILQRLFGNGWVHLLCIDPTEGKPYYLQRDLKWTKYF
jgi:uncharacterized protein YbcC (UPF0753/DUF2309 family)